MSLPLSWVDELFKKLGRVYGQSFLRKWDGMDMAEIKDDWAHELAGFQAHPEAIKWALENLPPERAPNVLEFRALANRAPAKDVPRLARQGTEVPDSLRGRIQQITQPTLGKDYRAWAKAIISRLDGGDKTLTKSQIDMARDAMKGHA